MNCPGCGANSSRQQPLAENQKRCGTCKCVWQMTETGASIIQEGQTFLSEVPEKQQTI